MGRYFTRQQIEEIRNQLAIRTVKDSDLPSTNTISLDDFVAIVQNGLNKKINILALYNDLGPVICERYLISLPIYTENGSNMLRLNQEADMVAKVMIGYEDVTSQVHESFFNWYRSSGDETSDRIWNMQHEGCGPRVHVSRQDINKSCTFYCTVPISALKDIN